MISIHSFFNWFYYKQKKHLYFNLGTGLFVWIFLALTLPFGMYDNNVDSTIILLLVILPFGLSWPLASYLVDWFVKYIIRTDVSDRPSSGAIIILIKVFLMVHLVFVARNVLSDWRDVYLSEYIQLWVGCSILLFIVYMPFSLYARSKFYHRLVGFDEEDPDSYIELKGEEKGTLKIGLNRIIYLKSDDNYVDIVNADNDGKVKVKVFRARLKSIEEQLSSQNQFIRIHRSYIINMQYMSSINKGVIVLKHSGNSFEIPVSRNYRAGLVKILS